MRIPRLPTAVLSLAAAACCALPAGAQTGPWKDGELVVLRAAPGYKYTRIDPTTGASADLIDVLYTGGWSGMAAFDPARDALLANVSLAPDNAFYYRLWAIDSSGAAVPIPGFEGKSLRALAPVGDGRVFYQEHTGVGGNQSIRWLDANDVPHVLMDQAGTSPFVFDVEHLLYHAASNSLLATNSGWWSSNECTLDMGAIFRIPLSADGTRVGGPVLCSSIGGSYEDLMSMDFMPGGSVLLTIASGYIWQYDLRSVDPWTLAITNWADTSYADLEGGYYSADLGEAVVLASGVGLVTFGAGEAGFGTPIPTGLSLGFGGFSPSESMIEVDVLGPGCYGYADVYGAGLAGSGGFTPSLTLGGCPDLGKTITLSLTSGLGGAPSVLLIAAAPASLPLLAGTLLVDPAAVQVPMFLGGAPGVGGAGNFSIPVLLNDPTLTGVATFLQHLSVDLQAPQYISFSNGLQIVFG